MTGRRTLTGVLVAATIAAGTLQGAMAAQAAPAVPTPPVCDPQWVDDRDGALANIYSPWFATRPDISGEPRSVQFHVGNVQIAQWLDYRCNLGPRTRFPSASKARYKDQDGLHGWGWINSGPNRNHRNPGACLGWDIVSQSFKKWSC
jgi:hypothetical protein